MTVRTLARYMRWRVTAEGCWEWAGYRTANGYGRINMGRDGVRYSHRVIYEFTRGPIPDGLHLDHLCRNPPCCNPEHLEPVTPAENNRRAGAVVAQCPRGHAYDDANTYVRLGGNGRRACRACHRENERRRRAKARGV